MDLHFTQQLSLAQKQSVFELWNKEYPATISFQTLLDFDSFLTKYADYNHILMLKEETVIGWYVDFIRENERWFSLLVSPEFQGQGMGRQLLEEAKRNRKRLCGWVVDSNTYLKPDGSQYLSPLTFYEKNDFRVHHDIRYETDALSALKISFMNTSMNTERTSITALSEKDIDEILDMYHEPDSNKFINPLLNKSDAFYRDFLTGKIESNKENVGFWAVRDISSGTFIGTVNLYQFGDTDMTHIGCHLKRQYWNQGYAFELLSELREYGINELQLSAIHGIFNEEHHVSQKLLTRLGFKPFDTLEKDGIPLLIYKYTP